MKVVHLVGNGFDIASGLRTSAPVLLDEFCRVVSAASDAPQFATDLAGDIQEKGLDYWCNFEIEIGQYSNNPLVSDNPIAYLRAKACFDQVLRECLLARVPLIDEAFVSTNAASCLSSLGSLFMGLEREERDRQMQIQSPIVATDRIEHYIATLNYLPTLEMLCKAVGYGSIIARGGNYGGQHTLSSFAYAHSSLDGMPVCGVDRVEQIANESFRENPDVAATVIKGLIQSDSGMMEDTFVVNHIRQADALCVHGASLGATDGRWWREIIGRMKTAKRVVLVISSHSFEGDYHISYFRRRDRGEAINRFFDAADAAEDEREMLRKRVFVTSSSHLFTIEQPVKDFETLSDDVITGIAAEVFQKDKRW